MERCDYCRDWTGIYLQSNRCCQVRRLALAPKAARLAGYAAARAGDGPDAEARLRGEVTAEYKRWQAYRATKETT